MTKENVGNVGKRFENDSAQNRCDIAAGGRPSRSEQPREGAHVAHHIARPRAVAALRRLGGGPPRLSRVALSRRGARQSGLLRLDRGAARASARHVPHRDHRGRDDLRDRQQGPRPVGRLHLRPGGRGVRAALRAELPRPRHCRRGPALSAAGRRNRAAERRARHHPQGSGVHRHADDAVHRPRLRAGAHPRTGHLLFRQGEGASAVLPPRRDQRARVQQPDRHLRRRRRGRRPRAGARPGGATRPSPPAATSRRRSMPASRPTGFGSAPT